MQLMERSEMIRFKRTPKAEPVNRTANTPIAELLAEYEAECCDFSDIAWVRKAAMRYVETMRDSQVRCLLYALAAYDPAKAVLKES